MPLREPGSAPAGLFGRALYRICAVVAGFGGLAMLSITALTVTSIAGREIAAAPIAGDFELVEIASAVAIFAFLPYCQLVRGNVIVDLFTEWAPLRTRAFLDLVANLTFTLIAAILTWRTYLGGMDILRYQEETMVLRIPLWLGFVAGVFGFGLLTVVCAYTSWRSYAEMRRGQRIDVFG